MSLPEMLTLGNQALTIRRADLAEIVDLRHRVLRAGLPPESAIFPGDDLPTSSHFAVVSEENVVLGCATFHLNTWQDQPAFQLRGMATEPLWAGRGLGKALLSFAMHSIRTHSPIRLFWCNARLVAIPFYQKLGWEIVSQRFEIPTAGPHHQMLFADIRSA